MVYTRTAAHEGYGGSLTLAITTDTKLPLNYGPGGARLITISANAGRKVRLPDARLLTPGPTVYVIRNSGANNFDVVASDNTTVVVTAVAGRVYECHLYANSTANGLWFVETGVVPGVSSTITAERVPMEMTFSFGQRVNLRTEAERRGYTGDYPLALRVEILSGGTVRSDDPAIPAMDTGVFYAGSTILLVNRGRLYGMGGTGGRGGLGSSANGSAGGAGGDGLFARHSVAVVNLGFIAGGGGGGGGGGSGTIAADGGGGGGGGAGQLGGVGGLGGVATAGAGGTGLIDVGGIRGNGVGNGAQGGNGGQIGGVGIAGSNGTGGTGGAGGAAGYSLRSAGGGPVISIVTAGTRYGSEVLS
jgi:hypothetical protein